MVIGIIGIIIGLLVLGAGMPSQRISTFTIITIWWMTVRRMSVRLQRA